MKKIYVFFIGFVAGKSTLLIAWVAFSAMEMLSQPEVNESFFREIEECDFSKITVNYKKKDLESGDIQTIRFSVADPDILKKLRESFRIKKIVPCFQTVMFEPDIFLYGDIGAEPWNISFEGDSTLFIRRNGKYCNVLVYNNSFYGNLLELCQKNDTKFIQRRTKIEL